MSFISLESNLISMVVFTWLIDDFHSVLIVSCLSNTGLWPAFWSFLIYYPGYHGYQSFAALPSSWSMHIALSALYSEHYTQRTIIWTLHSAHSIMNIALSALNSEHCTQHIVFWTLYSEHTYGHNGIVTSWAACCR